MTGFANRIPKVFIITFISFVLSLIIFFSGILNMFEMKAYDLFSRYLNPVQSSDDIIIIKVDQHSIDALSNEGIQWPWPRQIYAPIIEYLSEADAVFIDILFTEPSSYGKQDDEIFSAAMKKTSNVYLPLFLFREGKKMSTEDEEFIKRIAIKDTIKTFLSFHSALTPIDILKTSVKGSGNVTIPPDDDGVYRKIPVVFQLDEYTVPNYVFDYLLKKGTVTIRQGSLYAGEIQVPLYNGRLFLRYSRGKEPFQTIPAVTMLTAYRQRNALEEPAIKKEFFKGKKVFIGLTAAGLHDLKPTATLPVATGAFIHATTLENIVNNNFIRPISIMYVMVWMVFFCLVVCYFVFRYYSIYVTLPIFLSSLCIVFLSTVLLFKNGMYSNIMFPLISLTTTFILVATYRYAFEGKERRFVKRTFSHYMDKSIVEYILDNPHLIKPGGERRRVTVFFADIRGFTSIAEKVPAEKTAKLLHTVHNAFTEAIKQNKGIIDKYIGDCVMAFWGAPIATTRDEINACSAAIQCIESLKEINKTLMVDGLSEIAVRIGLHSGEAVVGNFGSDQRFNYTVVGDTVNIASRLESVNNLFKTSIIASEDVLHGTEDMFFTRELGKVEVKGKTLSVKIFELIAEHNKVTDYKRNIVAQFHRGIAFFKQQRFQDAHDVFAQILKTVPADGPSEFYKEQCEHFIRNPELTAHCDIIKLKEK